MTSKLLAGQPDFVARPSGVWNTRAPFHEYFRQHRRICRTYFGAMLAFERLRTEAHKADGAMSARAFFRAKKGSPVASHAWLAFKRSWPLSASGARHHATVFDVRPVLQSAERAATEHSIVSYSAMFETYLQCWALNCLLTKLEAGDTWSAEEKLLSILLSPLRGSKPLPGLPSIRKALPILDECLSASPHVATDPASGEDVTEPLSPVLNALRAIEFWRDYRNLLVHSSGLVSLRFFTRQAAFVEHARKGFPYLPELVVGKRLRVTDASFRALVSTHFVAARRLNAILLETSSGRRGHVFAPDPPREVIVGDIPEFAKPMIVENDHPESLRWILDEAFRESTLAAAGLTYGAKFSDA